MKWVIWVPWLRQFFTREGGERLEFDTEAEAKAFAADPHAIGWGYRAVPWDAQAQGIAAGGAL